MWVEHVFLYTFRFFYNMLLCLSLSVHDYVYMDAIVHCAKEAKEMTNV